MDSNTLKIFDNEPEKRFEADLGGSSAILDYRLKPGTITFLHLGVPPEFEGKGIGSSLAKAGLDHAREAGMKVIPRCPFVASYIKRHPVYADLVPAEFRSLID